MNFAKASSKIVLCLLALIYWGASACLTYVGVNMLMTYERYGDLVSYIYSIIPAFIILGIALVIFLIGIIGMCGLFSENKCLLATFFFLLTTLLSLEIAGVVLVITYQDNFNTYAKQLFEGVLDSYGQREMSSLTQNFDYLQHKLECCGQFNYTDWKHTWWFENSNERYGNVPQSCCVSFIMTADNEIPPLVLSSRRLGGAVIPEMQNYCKGQSPQPIPSDNYFVDGCYSKLKSMISYQFLYISGVCLGLLIIQFIGLLSTCILMFCKNKSKQQPPYINIATHDDIQYNL